MNWDPTVALIVAFVGAVLLVGIYLLGMPGKAAQIRRRGQEGGARQEPSLGADSASDSAAASGEPSSMPGKSSQGERADGDIEKIVTVHVEASDGRMIHGQDLVVAAEKAGLTYGATDDYSYNIVKDPVHVHDLNATILHCLGIDHERLTYRYQGRDFRLTDVHGRVVSELLA